MHLDETINFGYHVKDKTVKADKGIGIIHKLDNLLSGECPLTIYKLFVRLHLVIIFYQESSQPEVFYKKCVLKNLVEFRGKHWCHSLYFNEAAHRSLQL